MIAGAHIEQQLFDHVAHSGNSEITNPNGIIIEAVADGMHYTQLYYQLPVTAKY